MNSQKGMSTWWWAARIVCLSCIVAIWAGLNTWSGKKELDHDEFEHAHAAWLMQQGQRPYYDFLEHHPPYYWYFLQLYYDAHGDDLGVFAWGRRWMLITFAGSILFLYLIGRELADEATGLAAAVLFAANRLGHYPAMIMRSDGWMLFLLMAGAYVYLYAWNRKFRWYSALGAGALLGLSFGVLPKSGFTVLGLALLTAYQCQFKTGWGIVWQRKVPLLLFAGVSFVPIILPFIIYGLDYYHHMYVVATHVRPAFSPWSLFGNLVMGTFGLLPFSLFGAVVCAVRIRRKPRASFAAVAILLFFVLNVIQVLVTARPFVQAFYVLIPFFCLLAGYGVSAIAERFPAREQVLGVALVAVSGLLVNLHPPNWRYPPNLQQQIAQMKQLMALMPAHETYVGSMNYHPIFRKDGTYYWWELDLRSMQAVDPDFAHDFIDEFKRTQPYVVEENIFKRLQFDPDQVPRMKAYLERHYQKMPNAPLWVRTTPKRPVAPAAAD